jgi:Tfp pilus assembly protein PilF
MKPHLVGLCGIVLLLMLGCHRTWQDILPGMDRHKEAGPLKPDLADAEPEPEPKILPETFLAAGRLAETRGDVMLAAAMYRKAAALKPDYVEVYNRLGLVLGKIGQFKSADEALIAAVELEPESAYLRNNLAYSYLLQRRWSEAEVQLCQALELQPGFARARINLAVVFARVGRYEEAMEQFLLVLPPASAHYNLGLMQEMNRRYKLARGSFAQALAMNPSMTPARDALERMAMRIRATGVAQANQKLTIEDVVAAEPVSTVVVEPEQMPVAPEQGNVKPCDPVESANQPCQEDPSETSLDPTPPSEPIGAQDTPPRVEAPVTPDEASSEPIAVEEGQQEPAIQMLPSAPSTMQDPTGSVEDPVVPDERAAGPVAAEKTPEGSACQRWPVARFSQDSTPLVENSIPDGVLVSAMAAAKTRGALADTALPSARFSQDSTPFVGGPVAAEEAVPLPAAKTRAATIKIAAKVVGHVAAWWTDGGGQRLRSRLGRQFSSESGPRPVARSAGAPPLVLPDQIRPGTGDADVDDQDPLGGSGAELTSHSSD